MSKPTLKHFASIKNRDSRNQFRHDQFVSHAGADIRAVQEIRSESSAISSIHTVDLKTTVPTVGDIELGLGATGIER